MGRQTCKQFVCYVLRKRFSKSDVEKMVCLKGGKIYQMFHTRMILGLSSCLSTLDFISQGDQGTAHEPNSVCGICPTELPLGPEIG